MPKLLPKPVSVRSSAVLSATYEATTKTDVSDAKRVDWLLEVTHKGSVTRLDFQVQTTNKEAPTTDADWATVQTETIVAGVATLSDYTPQKDISGLTATFQIGIGLDARGRWMRLLVKAGAGAVTNSLASCTALAR